MPDDAADDVNRVAARLTRERIVYASDGLEVEGYVARPVETGGATLPCVIVNRGGMMTYLALRKSNRFRAAIVGAGLADAAAILCRSSSPRQRRRGRHSPRFGADGTPGMMARAFLREGAETMYSSSFTASWADMDFNAHMRSTAFLDRAADARKMLFAENGFPMSGLIRSRIGPVILKDEVEHLREIGLLERFSVDLQLAGLAPDGSRFALRNTISARDGRPCGRVTSHGGWPSLRSPGTAVRVIAMPAPATGRLQGRARRLRTTRRRSSRRTRAGCR